MSRHLATCVWFCLWLYLRGLLFLSLPPLLILDARHLHSRTPACAPTNTCEEGCSASSTDGPRNVPVNTVHPCHYTRFAFEIGGGSGPRPRRSTAVARLPNTVCRGSYRLTRCMVVEQDALSSAYTAALYSLNSF